MIGEPVQEHRSLQDAAERQSLVVAVMRWLDIYWFPFSAGLLLLAFGLFDVIEWLWLAEADPRLVHALHIAVGVATMLVIISVIGWLVQRASHPIWAAPTFDAGNAADFRGNEARRLERYARWFIQMRWIAVLVASLLLLYSIRIAHLLSPATESSLWITVGILVACNLLYRLLLSQRKWTSYLLRAQVYLDLVILTVLLQFSGGIENPLLFLTVFHVIIAGILLSRRQCYAVAAAASLLIAVMAWGEWAQVLPHHTLQLSPQHYHEDAIHAADYDLYAATAVGSLTVMLLLVAHFVTTLADRARADERLAREMAQRALAERQLLEQALTTTGAGLCVVDQQRSYKWVSSRWQEWFLAGQTPSAEVPLSQWSDSPAQQVLTDGGVRVTERLYHSSSPGLPARDREARIYQITTAPLRDGEGQVSQVVELAQDVTHQKRVQAQLLQAGKMAAVGHLAGNVVHEVNNPIGIISAKGRLLLSDHREEMSRKVAEEVAKITEAADRVAGICRSLLSYCRPSIGQRSAVDLRLPVRKAVALVEHRAQDGKVQIQDQLPDGLPLAHANANEMQQIFLNLLINALDAMPGGGKLTLSGFEDNSFPQGPRGVTVIVEDTGAGMSPQVLERIFDPFFSTKEEGNGTGLGLSICLGIVQSHGGAIDVDSEIGHGTRVAVRLPCEVTPRG